MNPVREFLLGVKAATASNPIMHPAYGVGGWWANRGGRKTVDLRKVGDGLSNSATYATVSSLGNAYAEPTIREYERVDSSWQIVEKSPVTELLADPNPHIEPDLMWAYEVAAIASTGAAYYHKRRDQLGQVYELWPLYPQFIRPETDEGSGDFISRWLYQAPGTMEIEVPVEDIIQRRWQINRTDHRIGWSALSEILIEIMQDQEASRFSTALLVNMGVPGVVLSPGDPDDPGPSDPSAVAREFKTKFSGEKVGEPFVASRSLKVDMISFNPEQMDLSALRRVPEERITAALGWPAILAGLGAGLDRATYSNAETLREFATEQRLIPLWRASGRQWTRQLLRDVPTYGPVNTQRELRFDLTEVRALQKDEKEEVDKLDVAIQGGWATVAEGRRSLNLPVVPTHDVFLRTISKEAVGETDDPFTSDPVTDPDDA